MRRGGPGDRHIGHGTEVADLVRPVLSTPGNPLDHRTRRLMEPVFGRSFGEIRVHTDTAADRSARMVGAAGYAVGNHLAFAHGHYAPQTAAGRGLLAHELAHVVQQDAVLTGAPASLRVDDGGEAAASRAATGSLAADPGAAGATMQRQVFGFAEVPFPEIGEIGEPMPEFGEIGEPMPDIGELGDMPDIGELGDMPDIGEAPTEGEGIPEGGDGVPEGGDGVPEGGEWSWEPPPEIQPQPQPMPQTGPQPIPYPWPIPPVWPAPQPGEGEEEKRDPLCGTPRMPVTQVTYTTGPLGQGRAVLASPLTKCPGNTIGSFADERVYGAQFQCLRRNGVRRNWQPVHLLHGRTRRSDGRNLHGPGDQRWNIIIASTSINKQIYDYAEWAAVTRIHDLNQVLWYQVNVDEYFPGNEFFARSISIQYGLYNTAVGGPVNTLGGRTFVETDAPPNCPPTATAGPTGAAAPAAGGAAAATSLLPSGPADWTSTFDLCRILRTRRFPIQNGGIRVTLAGRWKPSGSPLAAALSSWNPTASGSGQCEPQKYLVLLKRHRPVLWDPEMGRAEVSAGKVVTITWRYLLEDDDYYLDIVAWPYGGSCCLEGAISVETFNAPRPRRRRMESFA